MVARTYVLISSNSRQKHEYTGLQLPVTLGHEMSGTVIEVGSSVSAVRIGQKCTVNPSVHDQHYGLEPCRNCRAGKTNLCSRWACYGLNAQGGGLADEIVVNIASLIPIPATVSLKVAALCEPLAVALHMIRGSGLQRGHCVLVLGAGPIGLALLILLKTRGAARVILSEPSETRALKAKELGADLVINPTEKFGDDEADVVVHRVHSLTEDGVDVAFDTTGVQATLDTAIRATRSGGTIFNVAIHEKPLLIDPNLLTLHEKRYMGGICYTNEDFEMVLDALGDGTLVAEELITSIVPLEDAVEGAFKQLIYHKEKHVKILIQPGHRQPGHISRN
ncbi:hypothetical protein D6C87_06841 [Aureobasidium pullulans]|uniref:GroES-like protein n=1 Tax=Aureobasidium pullulans TaxID=5580 RepID=A0AB38LZU4_AURPU|nr:hypothetical protein D6C94_05225 [Aureobasidium pullulans]THZ39838.1 hypothetical protein D6C87_06841 [Aureobasidium pullulans]